MQPNKNKTLKKSTHLSVRQRRSRKKKMNYMGKYSLKMWLTKNYVSEAQRKRVQMKILNSTLPLFRVQMNINQPTVLVMTFPSSRYPCHASNTMINIMSWNILGSSGLIRRPNASPKPVRVQSSLSSGCKGWAKSQPLKLSGAFSTACKALRHWKSTLTCRCSRKASSPCGNTQRTQREESGFSLSNRKKKAAMIYGRMWPCFWLGKPWTNMT
eukprot:Lithocolla_globosa_v1_NODE_5882_length_1170_cov_12.260090.p2 type:complete len:213 gc:universal NODE_5882_length_1170_cov_12.260090:907-269(-)